MSIEAQRSTAAWFASPGQDNRLFAPVLESVSGPVQHPRWIFVSSRRQELARPTGARGQRRGLTSRATTTCRCRFGCRRGSARGCKQGGAPRACQPASADAAGSWASFGVPGRPFGMTVPGAHGSPGSRVSSKPPQSFDGAALLRLVGDEHLPSACRAIDQARIDPSLTVSPVGDLVLRTTVGT